uniref:Uncharacterized protein n=2 Tax=Rhodosorus marinus TaxID=101924 RepID=A0A7S3E5R2_9RHOD|mmetsp:Transcript_11033/g.45964  ORF Transcript_11033/g.45964 Transcript_11033/m.45964 type:complete len:144 (+) Transcript_11033:1006-1437(+)
MEWKTQKGLLQIVERRDVEGIRELLQSWRRPHEEENFDEALRKAYLVMFSPERNVLSSEAFDGRKGEDGKGPSSSLNRSFWLFVASLKKFVEEEGTREAFPKPQHATRLFGSRGSAFSKQSMLAPLLPSRKTSCVGEVAGHDI